jgi:hypothetical protein
LTENVSKILTESLEFRKALEASVQAKAKTNKKKKKSIAP